ncbi:MAG: ABC transporter ATP-binding protein [Cyanobacteria bacterium CRU_2_1]|nr:ABC transporter ATP-binding protein [Cyanobacteria bacterium RU_5_0]NJR63780.1 ABC transporter ATP-binding protein [Cyanobacteria bacterium CRU_2_1]
MSHSRSPDSSPILQLDSVTRQFASVAAPAVCNVTLMLKTGDILGLLGPSGCGKTTLLRLIAGFEQPQSGTIAIAEQPVAGSGYWTPPERRGVGMVFQDYALFPHLTVSQNIAFGLSQKPTTVIGQRVKEAIALVGLDGMDGRYPHQLSGGQQQRVALARALAPHPFLVLLDEPLSNLDVQVRLRLRQELRAILNAAGTSAVFVTHDQEEALSIADQVAVMREGCLEQIGTPEVIYREPTSRFVAEFVTQANFLSAQRRDRVWETEVGCFPMDETIGSTLPDVAEHADLMIRQEDVSLLPDEQGEVILRDRQFLGREYRYCLQTASGQDLIARTPAETVLPIGTPVKLSIAAKAIRVFPGSMRRLPDAAPILS